MLSHDLRAIFVHVPKAGGQSVERVFCEWTGTPWAARAGLLLAPNPKPKTGPLRLDHLAITEYESLGFVTAEQATSYFSFGFVRNPFARLVSEYKFREYPRQFDFKTYVMDHLPAPAGTAGFFHTLPMYHFLTDADGKVAVDFVGRMEEFQSDFDTACKMMGRPPTQLPHINKSAVAERRQSQTATNPLRMLKQARKKQQRKANLRSMQDNLRDHYTEYYDTETQARVAEMYSKDLELFGYTFEGSVGKMTDNR